MACKRTGGCSLSLSSSSSSAVIWDLLQHEGCTVAKRHNHAVAHPLHCSAMPHVACAFAIARGLQENSRGHPMSKLRKHIQSVMLKVVQSYLSTRSCCNHVRVLSKGRHQHHDLCLLLRLQGGPFTFILRSLWCTGCIGCCMQPA